MSVDDEDVARWASRVQRMLAAAAATPASTVAAPTSTADQVSDQGRFAAREFLAKYSLEADDRLLFAYEMGYLRGHSEGMRASMAIYDELKGKRADDESK